MAYQKKYYFSFKDIRATERTHLVELWQNTTETITAEEIKGHNVPFSVEMPEIDHKFQVVRGTGCQIDILSETDMKFLTGLYHVNPTDFMVKHYIDGVINWLGYLNSEMITEPYDIDFNYLVSVTGNDGFSLMDRFSFMQIDESNYTGVKSKFELLQIIFAKIGLPFTEYRIALATTFTGQSADVDSTILHESFVDCANFYDEDNKPMSLRAVVESILAPYGAHIRAEGGNIYIVDIHSLASSSTVTYKRFTMSTGAYVADIAVSNEKSIADIGYRGTGQNIERSGGVNRQVVSYSPYPTKTILDESLVGIDEFGTVPGSWSSKNGYYYKTLLNSSIWQEYSPGGFEISYFGNPNDANVYLRWPVTAVNQKIASLKLGPYINVSGTIINPDQSVWGRYLMGIAMFFTGEILIKTKNNPYDEDQSSRKIYLAKMTIKVKVGNTYADDLGFNTSNVDETFNINISEYPNVIADRFVSISNTSPNGVGIDIYDLINGNVEFEIWSDIYTRVQGHSDYDLNSSDVQEIWVKNLSLNLKTLYAEEINDNDIEYIGLLDRNFQNEGEKITLTCGTDTQFADRGKLLKFDGTNYSDITEWTRNNQSFKIEELLLGSVSSNHRAGYLTLTNMNLNNTFDLQNILTDTFIGSAKMMVKSAKINYRDNISTVDLVEILPDELIIVKDATIT